MGEPLPLSYFPGAVGLSGENGGTVVIDAHPDTVSYTLLYPPFQGLGALTNDGTGNLSWVADDNIIVTDASILGQFIIEQQGSGNSNMVFKDPNESWSVGIDQSDSSKFKITDGVSHGGVTGTGDMLTIDADGVIMMGNSVSRNSIFLNGGIEYQFDLYSSYPPSGPDTTTGTDLNLTKNHYFVKLGTSAYTGVILPLASQNSGRMYIVSRGFATSASPCEIKTQGVDTLEDGVSTSSNIPVKNGKIKLISDGLTSWLYV
jgi:hypothetical protein